MAKSQIRQWVEVSNSRDEGIARKAYRLMPKVQYMQSNRLSQHQW